VHAFTGEEQEDSHGAHDLAYTLGYVLLSRDHAGNADLADPDRCDDMAASPCTKWPTTSFVFGGLISSTS
jgi:hypothetical protein